MKKYIIPMIVLSVALTTSCNLDKDPISDYSELTRSHSQATYTTRTEIKAAYDAIYTYIKGSGQEYWMLDALANFEVRSDNAYAGTIDLPVVSVERNIQGPDNSNIARDWRGYLSGIARANLLIANIDGVTDAALTDVERRQWKAEAQIFRAWMYFEMVRMWGEVPLIPAEKLPTITSENIGEIYTMLYPEKRNTIAEVYEDILTNLGQAVQNAPEVNAADKFLLTKGVANALLAKVYAEKPVRDYAKTIQYCDAVIASGYNLVADYADLFQLNATNTDAKLRNSSESIFEITYQGGGCWVGGIVGKNYTDPNSSINWRRWVAPSRSLIADFDSEGDVIRKAQSIVYESVNYSDYYPKENYPFVYKLRSNATSVIKLRLADILLLKAEALVATGDLAGAATLVNQVRARVNLPALASNITSSASAMKEAVLKERRLELAFEGHRWFDLLRNDAAVETMNTLNSKDSGRLQINPMTEQTTIYPIPQTEIDKNPKLGQNAGY